MGISPHHAFGPHQGRVWTTRVHFLSFGSTLNAEEAIVHAITVDSDECDACGEQAHVQAYLYAEMPSGHTLSYCGSHGTRYLDGLIRQGAKVIDMRHLIHS